MGPRFAQKVFLGYVLPLAVLLAFGLLLPIFLWSYLGRSVIEYDARVRIVDRAEALRRAAIDTEDQARSFIRYHERGFEERHTVARETYRTVLRDLSDLTDTHDDPTLRTQLNTIKDTYRRWIRDSVSPRFRTAQIEAKPGHFAAASGEQVHREFEPVQVSLDTFINTASLYRDRQREIARTADWMRHITSIVIPLVAVVLSLLIGRSIALGITRPIEALTRATEELERGNAARLLFEDDGATPDDEIGDLQQAFRRMAQTIRQREAVLRAQNEAVGSLNRRVEAVLNATNDGILMLDRGGGFSVINQRFARLFGLEMQELLDHTFAQAGPLLLSRFRNKVVVRQRFQEIIDDPETIADEVFELAHPVARTLRIYSAPVRGLRREETPTGERKETPELLGRIFVFRDVTRETMVDRMKTEFVSTVSHELRTPLTAIKGYIDLMVNGQTGPLNDVQTEFLTMVQGSTRRLTDLINDMLDISRIESGRMEIRQEAVNYVPLVRQSVRMMQREADQRRITLAVEVIGEDKSDTMPVSGDADRITQVLTNFLSNGIKYTPPGGSVTIRIQFDDNFVTTCVADTGIGISADDQNHLFQKFFRADNSTTREVGGTGLGLAITKTILEKLNGSVWVDSTPGQGSRFWFTLPCADVPAPLPLPTNGHGAKAIGVLPPSAHRLALTIDSNVSTLHRLSHELRRQGFVTASAANMSDALRRARDLRPDIITLDPLTPHLDGFAFLRALRQQPGPRRPPVALLSLDISEGRARVRGTVRFLPSDTPLGILENRVEEMAPEGDGFVLIVGNVPGSQSLPRRTLVAATPAEADALLQQAAPDLTILDANALPGTGAGEWVKRLRDRFPEADLPLLVLTDAPVRTEDGVFALAPDNHALPVEEIGPLLETLLVSEKSAPPPVPVAVATDEKETADATV